MTTPLTMWICLSVVLFDSFQGACCFVPSVSCEDVLTEIGRLSTPGLPGDFGWREPLSFIGFMFCRIAQTDNRGSIYIQRQTAIDPQAATSSSCASSFSHES